MSTILDTLESTAPAYWASYLINSDPSGLEDDEIADCDSWIADLMQNNPGLIGQPVDCGESYFSHGSDASRLAGDVCTYTFLIYAAEVQS